MSHLTRFEKEIQNTYQIPEPNPTFISSLEMKIKTQPREGEKKSSTFLRLSRGWVYAAISLIVLAILLFIIGPSNVLAQIQSILGFVPGIGIVESDTSFFTLVEPISDTKEDITIQIESAVFSQAKTVIQFRMEEIPDEMRVESFGQPECKTPAFLKFPNGTIVQTSRHSTKRESNSTFLHTLEFFNLGHKDFPNATLILPCLDGTAINKGPQDWQFTLALEPTIEDIDFFSVNMITSTKIENTKKYQTDVPEQASQKAEIKQMPEMIIDGDRQKEMTLLSVVENPDSYWVTWAFPLEYDKDVSMNGELFYMPYSAELFDSHGKKIPMQGDLLEEFVDYQQDLLRQLPQEDQSKYFQSMLTFTVPKSGVDFPVYVKKNVIDRSFPEKENFTEVEFDGNLIQYEDQRVDFNQEIEIGDIKFTLKSIYINQFSGYAFYFDGTGGNVFQCNVEIVGYPSNFHGDWHGISGERIVFEQSVMFPILPSGLLTARISLPAILGDTVTYIGSWSPGD